MKWKRLLHKQNGTTLIECYACEDAEGILEESLKSKLSEAGVEFKDIMLEDLLKSSGNSF